MDKMRCYIFAACLCLMSASAARACDQPSICPTSPPVCPTLPPVCPTAPAVCPTPPPAKCELFAVPDELWPPNHKFVEITLVDSEGNVVNPTITGVFQDEPTLVIGSGNFCPDAIVNETVSVRSERTGVPGIPGDGRVYHIQFTLDTASGPCSGEVTVCVPHDQRPGHVCVDQGPLYDSLQCGTNGLGAVTSSGKKKVTAFKGKKKR